MNEVEIYHNLKCGHKIAWVYSVTRNHDGTMIYKMECKKCGTPETKHFTKYELIKKDNEEKNKGSS